MQVLMGTSGGSSDLFLDRKAGYTIQFGHLLTECHLLLFLMGGLVFGGSLIWVVTVADDGKTSGLLGELFDLEGELLFNMFLN